MLNLKGSLVALVTPFNNDGSVNYEKFEELLNFHLNHKTDGIVILGTTAESPTLTFEEEEKLVSLAVKVVNKRVPLIVGSGSNSTETALTYSKKYEKLGADALLLITPYYNKTNERGMIEHFKSVADNVSIPVIMYNVPSRTGCSLSVNAVKVLSKHKNIYGIKEASGNISFAAKIAKYLNDDFIMLSGNDDQIVPMMSLGAKGVISVLANVMPETVHSITDAYLNGDIKTALKLQLKYLDLCNDLFIETNPSPVKEALNYLGFNVGPCRLPLYDMDEANKEKLHQTLDEVGGVL